MNFNVRAINRNAKPQIKLPAELWPVLNNQINYSYKSKPHQIWVYGNERKVYAKKKPFEFTSKMVIIIETVTIIGIVVAIYMASRGAL